MGEMNLSVHERYHMHMSRYWCHELYRINEMYVWNMTLCDDNVIAYDVLDN